ncbi:MAG: hypothetical protein Q8N48_08415 [Thiobacillus sp.]|nr:hypothetical protein [Thiobacillus sp.]MDP2978834.1 hypothetical protein [Thiobacillus sp.]
MAIWKAQRTLLIVGEGRHEEAFLNHVKQLYAPRGCGLSVTIKNARGKGAGHVIDWTIGQAAIAKFDDVAAMLDTDGLDACRVEAGQGKKNTGSGIRSLL